MTILNLTQHAASSDQTHSGVVNLSGSDLTALKSAITFNSLPSQGDLYKAAGIVVNIATSNGATSAMIGGAPFFMPILAQALKDAGINAMYAFSQRVAIDGDDGKKVSVFKHIGFIQG